MLQPTNLSPQVKCVLILQKVRIISEGSCDTEDWSKGCIQFGFATTGINYILKYFKIENSSFKL